MRGEACLRLPAGGPIAPQRRRAGLRARQERRCCGTGRTECTAPRGSSPRSTRRKRRARRRRRGRGTSGGTKCKVRGRVECGDIQSARPHANVGAPPSPLPRVCLATDRSYWCICLLSAPHAFAACISPLTHLLFPSNILPLLSSRASLPLLHHSASPLLSRIPPSLGPVRLVSGGHVVAVTEPQPLSPDFSADFRERVDLVVYRWPEDMRAEVLLRGKVVGEARVFVPGAGATPPSDPFPVPYCFAGQRPFRVKWTPRLPTGVEKDALKVRQGSRWMPSR